MKIIISAHVKEGVYPYPSLHKTFYKVVDSESKIDKWQNKQTKKIDNYNELYKDKINSVKSISFNVQYEPNFEDNKMSEFLYLPFKEFKKLLK